MNLRCHPPVGSRQVTDAQPTWQSPARPPTPDAKLLQDWLALSTKYYTRPAQEETINDPTNPHHYWRYRMQPCVEDLLEDRELIVTIQNMSLLSGRTTADEVPEPLPREPPRAGLC
jgi:hypothetical protein